MACPRVSRNTVASSCATNFEIYASAPTFIACSSLADPDNDSRAILRASRLQAVEPRRRPRRSAVMQAIRSAVSFNGRLLAKAAAHSFLGTHRRAAGIKLISGARRQFVTSSCWAGFCQPAISRSRPTSVNRMSRIGHPTIGF